MSTNKPFKTTRTELLPQEVLTAIQLLELKGFHFANAIQIACAVIRLKNRDRLTLEEYKSISSGYFAAISQNYQPAFAALKKANIVQTYSGANGKQYSTAARVAKAYRLNPELMSRTEAPVKFKVKTTSFRTSNLPEEMEAWILGDLQGLAVDVSKAREAIEEHLELLCLSEWEVTARSPEYAQNSFLQVVRFGIDPRKYQYRTQALINEVLAKPENVGKALYRQGEAYVIDTPQAFLARKNKNILSSWSRCVHNLEKGQYYAKRAVSNNRISTNITETPTDLLGLGIITYKGEELEEVDVANSQIACLAHVMLHGDVLRDGVDFPELELTTQATRFLEGSQQGRIYTVFAKVLECNRDGAKTEMFRQVFGGLSKGTYGWKKLQSDFGPVAVWLETVKQRNINLASYLQRLEAWIMMEQVYPELKRAGLIAFSKHDSYLVPISQVSAVERIMETIFTRIGYLATLKNKTCSNHKSVVLEREREAIVEEEPVREYYPLPAQYLDDLPDDLRLLFSKPYNWNKDYKVKGI